MARRACGGRRRLLRWVHGVGLVLVCVTTLVAAWARSAVLRDLHPCRGEGSGPTVERSLRGAFLELPLDAGGDTSVYLLSDNTQAWLARWWLIHQARTSLDVSYFILDQDAFGLAFLGALLARADEGVRVRILLDGIGTDASRQVRGNDLLDELQAHPNVEVRVFRSVTQRLVDLARHRRWAAFIASNHEKIIVADRRLAMTGGRNIAAHYFADPRHHSAAFEDYDVLLEGQAAGAAATGAFERLYQRSGARPPAGDNLNLLSQRALLLGAYRRMEAWLDGRELEPSQRPGGGALDRHLRDELREHPDLRGAADRRWGVPLRGEVRLLESDTHLVARPNAVTLALERILRVTRREVVAANPYLVLHHTSLPALEEAGRRGVALAMLTNSMVSTDNAVSQALFMRQWPELAARVPTLALYVKAEPGTLHAKVATFDGVLSLIGTFNLDPTAMAMNAELVVAIWSPEVAREVTSYVTRRIDQGPPQVLRYDVARHPDGTARRDREGAPVVTLGPLDHASPEEYGALALLGRILPWAERWVRVDAFMRPDEGEAPPGATCRR